jgi:PhnB protein
MKAFQPYLNFDGNTREAMTFYHESLGGNLEMQSFKDSQAPAPPGSEDRILHARLSMGSAVLMASDTMPDTQFTKGNNVWVNVDCDSIDEIERIFPLMGVGGRVLMPLADQFWGARFGMLVDKFGVNWMFNCETKQG